MSKKKKNNFDQTPAATPVKGDPDTSFELVNKYGTYEIQPTADTANAFPTIAQGFPKNGKKPTIKHNSRPDDNEI